MTFKTPVLRLIRGDVGRQEGHKAIPSLPARTKVAHLDDRNGLGKGFKEINLMIKIIGFACPETKIRTGRKA
jgi:hypothetical protein